LSHRYCYLPLSWKSWNWFECVVGGERHPQHTVVCASNDGWWYHPKHVEQFPDKLNCVTLHLVGYILEYYFHTSPMLMTLTTFQIVTAELGIFYAM
jgi:hypothetical protein